MNSMPTNLSYSKVLQGFAGFDIDPFDVRQTECAKDGHRSSGNDSV